MSLLPLSDTRDMVWEFMPRLNRSMLVFYQMLIAFSAAGCCALFLCPIPVSISMTGIIRPALERTDVHSVGGGIIEKILVQEGDTVEKNALLMFIRDAAGSEDAVANERELAFQQNVVEDLNFLTRQDSVNAQVLQKMKTALCREQAAAWLSKAEAENLNWTGAKHDADLGRVLMKDKVISRKEYYDQELHENKMRTSLSVARRLQWMGWQSALVEHRQALAICISRRAGFRNRAEQLEIRAPVSGVVQGLRSWYPGSVIRPEQSLCSVSPEGDLIGECYVASKDAGLLRSGQMLRIRIDAFNANYFGQLIGHIASISNDISMVGDRPVFTVRCVFSQKTGERISYRGLLKKGLGFQARCMVTERTLFQLLYDSMEDWFDPISTSFHAV